MKKLTAKAKVLAAWPNAHSYQWAGPCGWVIYSGNLVNIGLGQGATAAIAWADAMKHVRPKKRTARSRGGATTRG